MESSQTVYGNQTASDMDVVLDDEFEITIESPREPFSANDGTNSILKLIQNGDQTENQKEKMDIPIIVITDLNNGGGDQDMVSNDEVVDNKDMEDDFTPIVDETSAVTEASAKTENQMEFSNILSDPGVSAEITDNSIIAEVEIGVQQQEGSLADIKSDLDAVDSDAKHQNVESHADQNADVYNAEQPLNDDETNLELDSTVKGDTDEGRKQDLRKDDDALPQVQQSEERSISLDSILMKEKSGEDSDPDEFDFDLPTPGTQSSSEKKVTFTDNSGTDSDNKQSAIKSDVSEAKKENIAMATKQEQPVIISGNKPVAVIKPTTQTTTVDQSKYQLEGASSSVNVEEYRNQQVLESAQAEWDQVTTITAGFSDKDTAKGPEPTVVATTPAMSPHEMVEYLHTEDFSHVKSSIKTSVERRGFSAFVHALFGPPKLHRSLHPERDLIFCTAAAPLSNENSYHTRTLQTIYRCLTGSKFDCPRTGSHWEEIGFQGNDPATDLRGAGLLGLVNLLYFLKDPKKQGIANDIYRLSLHPTQNFPFCVMGINMSRITLQSLREDILNKECNKRGDVLGVINDFYVGIYLQMYQVWKSQGKTIQDSGYVIKDLEINAKRNPRTVLKNLDDYLNRKKTVIVADKSPDIGGDNFLSLCEDKT